MSNNTFSELAIVLQVAMETAQVPYLEVAPQTHISRMFLSVKGCRIAAAEPHNGGNEAISAPRSQLRDSKRSVCVFVFWYRIHREDQHARPAK